MESSYCFQARKASYLYIYLLNSSVSGDIALQLCMVSPFIRSSRLKQILRNETKAVKSVMVGERLAAALLVLNSLFYLSLCLSPSLAAFSGIRISSLWLSTFNKY